MTKKRPRSLSKGKQRKAKKVSSAPKPPQNPYKRDWQQEAWDKGVAAKKKGDPFECPLDDYPRSLPKAWEKGYKDQASYERSMAEFQAPMVQSRQPVVSRYGDSRFYRQDDEPEDSVLVRGRAIACPECKRRRLDNLSQACVVVTTKVDHEGDAPTIARMRCRGCGHTFGLVVKVV